MQFIVAQATFSFSLTYGEIKTANKKSSHSSQINMQNHTVTSNCI